MSTVAERLGVSTRQVQHLVARGDLRQVARGVIDESSVDRFLAIRGDSRRRAWSEATAWGAVALLAGAEAGWLGSRQRTRLKERLRDVSSAGLVERTRDRAVVTRYRAHSSAGPYLRAELVHPVNVAAQLGLAEVNDIDGYLRTADVEGVVMRHGLIRDDEGRATLRATTMDLEVVRDLADRGAAVMAGLDLAESLDVRERRAGLLALDYVLEDFRA